MNAKRSSPESNSTQQLVLFDAGDTDVPEQENLEYNIDPRQVRYEYPDSTGTLRRSQLERNATSGNTSEAYAELGGGAGVEDDNSKWYDQYLDVIYTAPYTPHDIIQGFEQLNMAKLMAANPKAIELKETSKLALHFNAYILQLRNRTLVLGTEGGYLDSHFEKYGFRNQEDAHEYSDILRYLQHDLLESDMGKHLHRQAQLITRIGNRALSDIKRHRGRLPYVTWDTKRQDFHVHYEVETQTKNHVA